MTDQPKDLWTQILDFLTQIIAPLWGDLIQYIPLLLLFAIVGFAANTALQWRRAAKINRGRVIIQPRYGPPPAGLHLPGPSRWPLILPIGAALLFASLALAPRDEAGALTLPFNVPLFSAGLLVLFIALGGWLVDAMKEWRTTEGIADPTLPALAQGRQLPDEPPPGVHLPSPSPWPFFVPVAAAFMFAGLAIAPALLVGGVVMFLISVIGWYLDAGKEYRQVEAGEAPNARPMDHEKAFPKQLTPVFLGIGAVAVLVAASPFLFSLLPSPDGGADASAAPSADVPAGPPEIVARVVTQFETTSVTVAADEPFELIFHNEEAGVPHNVAILEGEGGSALFTGEVVTGPVTVTYDVPALSAGSYPYICSVHPIMKGTLTAQ